MTTLAWYVQEVKDAAHSKLPVVKVSAGIAAMWVALLVMNEHVGPFVEGKLWPVIAGTHVTWAKEMADGTTIFYGTSTKLRACSFDHVEWYWRSEADGIEVQVPVSFGEKAKIRRPGEFAFGPWSIPLSKQALLHESYAIVWHRCHAFGLTASWFYP